MVKITIREALPGDRATIAAIIVQCYQDVAFSDHREHLMVERLQASSAYIAQLSLVAEVDGVMAGHVMMTRIAIKDPEGDRAALSLAPLSVSPAFQRQGVGSALVEAAHVRARALGFGAVILVGISGYYARFGYVPLDEYPICLPFDVAPANRMAIALFAPMGSTVCAEWSSTLRSGWKHDRRVARRADRIRLVGMPPYLRQRRSSALSQDRLIRGQAMWRALVLPRSRASHSRTDHEGLLV